CDVTVPQRIRRALRARQRADPGAQYKIGARGDLPGENTAAGGVVERVFCEARGDGVFGAMQGGVAEIQGVRSRRRPAQRRLPSLEVQVLDVERAPDI